MPRLAASLIFRVALFAGLSLLPTWASAQEVQDAPPAHVSFVDGGALLERDGGSETAAASMPLLAGDRIRTQGGRVEVLYGDGSTLHLDANTLVDFQSDAVIRLLNGRVRLSIVGATRSVAYRIDAPAAWVDLATAGEYRVVVGDGSEVELAVLRGAADLINEDGRTSIRAGERAFARTGARPSSAYVFNSAAWDSFDRWSEARRDARLGVSADYLPETVQPYASTFNEYGTWRNVDTYGHVWYPRVSVGWRPYYRGRWTTLKPWGWTWIGYDPWAWPTHHYGRWGFSAGSWFWIPGRTWGPAYVSWAYAPGYVSWCPLGWNNYPAVQFGYRGGYGRYYNPWNAWTVVPHRGFGRGDVHVNVVNASRFDVRTRDAFVVRNSAPDYRGYAVPRSEAPIRTAVSRSSTFGNSAAVRSYSRSGSVAAAPAAGADAAATFRSRRSSGGSLQGPGYPEPARAPQAVPRNAGVPVPDRAGAASRSRTGEVSAPAMSRAPSTAVPTRESGASRSRVSDVAPSAAPSQAERRAVPRSAPAPSAAAPAPVQPSTPDLSAFGRRTREYRGTAESPASRSPASDPVSSYPRAVPRGERPDNSVYAPRRESSVPQSSPAERTPSYRREAPGMSRPQGMDRPAAAPAPRAAEPSRAPERSSAPPSRAGEGSGSRSSGGAQTTGRARSRGGD